MSGYLPRRRANLVVDLAGLHGTAAGAVDLQHHALRSLVFERGLQSRNDVVGTGAAGSLDLTLDFHHRSALVEAEPLAAGPHAKRREKNEEEKSKREQLEKIPQRRARRCSRKPSVANRSRTRRSQLSSIIPPAPLPVFGAKTPPSRSRTSTGARRAPRHGPETQNPLSGSYSAPVCSAHQV